MRTRPGGQLALAKLARIKGPVGGAELRDDRAAVLRSSVEMNIEALPAHRLDDAIELWRQVGLTRPWNDPRDDLHRALASPSSIVLAGLDRETLISTAMVGYDGHRGWVYYLAVRPGFRGYGHGRAIMNASEAWLAERQVPKLNIMVRGNNVAAIGFYEALGYTRDDVMILSRRLHRS